jgi:WD40 repeat protein
MANASAMEHNMDGTSIPDQFYVTGGTLPSGAPSYVVRSADTDLYQSLSSSEFCYVLNTRQMGKSSLMIRTANRLRSEGVKIAIIDLTAVGQNLSPEQWYLGMLTLLGEQLDLEDELEDTWQETARLGPMQRWMETVRRVVLARLDTQDSRIVIFVDEIDAVRSLPFSADEFFAGIRECYNRRTQDPVFERITFCLLGVANPADLIMESRMSPFNIGRRIVVTDFSAAEAAPLALGMPGGKSILDRVLYWTGGHPYLTQRLCKSLSDRAAENPQFSNSDVDRLCEELFLTKTARESDDNLAFVHNRLLKSEVDIVAMLEMYRDIHSGKRVLDDETNPVVPVLRLSGVVRVEDGILRVRNRIYGTVFNTEWILSHMPHAELRRQQRAYRTGLLRSALISATVVLAAAYLAFNAQRNFERENHLRQLAVASSKEAELNQKQAEKETAVAKRAQIEAWDSEQKARDSAIAAFDEASRADRNEKEVLAANRKIMELAAQRKAALDERQSALSGAIAARRQAKLEAANSNRLLYIANMNLAQQAYENSNIARVLDLLRESDAGNQHGFEWGYWLRACSMDLITLRGHTNHVTAVACFPDGRRIATGGFDRTLRIWDILLGREVQRVPVQVTGPITGISISGDGNRIAVGSIAQQVQVIDLHNPIHIVANIRTTGSAVLSVALSRDGTRVVTGGGDQRNSAQVAVWNADNGKAIYTRFVTMASITGVAYSNDGRYIAGGGSDGRVRIWDAATGREAHILPGHRQSIICVAFSPDSRQIATGSYDNTARVWDIESEQPIFTITGHTQAVGGIAFSPDGSRIATAGYDNVARITNAVTGQPILALKGHTDPVSSVCFTPDGKRLITGSFDNTARVWDATRRRDMLTLTGHLGTVMDIAVSPDGSSVYSGGNDGTVRQWSAISGQQTATLLSQKAFVTTLAISKDGALLLVGDAAGTLHVIETRTHHERLTINTGPAPVTALAMSPNSAQICVAVGMIGAPQNTGLIILNAENGSLRHTLLKNTAQVMDLAYSPDGNWLACGGADNMVRVYNTQNGMIRNSWKACPNETAEGQGASYVTGICWSPDGLHLAGTEADQTGSGDNTARIWDSRTGKIVSELRGHANSLYSIAFSPDGRRLVTGSADKTARVWDTQTGREVLTLKGHDNVVLKCMFSHDGNKIITCSADDTVKIWARQPDRVSAPPVLKVPGAN